MQRPTELPFYAPSRRDYFAAAALRLMVCADGQQRTIAESTAALAVEIADALIAALDNQDPFVDYPADQEIPPSPRKFPPRPGCGRT